MLQSLIKLTVYGLLLISAALPLSSRAFINVSNIQFENLTVADGLSQSTVLDIVEDSQGFIWFATGDGLNRFDGYEFKHYLPSQTDQQTLPDKLIRKLFVDTQGALWVGTQNGLAKYNPESDSFFSYAASNSNLKTPVIGEIAQGLNGEIWVADESHLYAYNKASDQFNIVTLDGKDVFNEVRVILDTQDYLWIGSYGYGIDIFDKKSQKLHALNSDNPWSINIPATYLFDLAIIDGSYWLATEQGVFILSDKFELQKHLYSGSADGDIVGNTVSSIIVDRNGLIWIGTTEGLSIFSNDSSEIVNVGKNNINSVNLKTHYILKLFKDRNGTIWSGGFAGGVHIQRYLEYSSYSKQYASIPGVESSLSDNLVWAFAETQDKKVWIATQSGNLNLFSPDSGTIKQFINALPMSTWDLDVDRYGRLWLATERGVLVFKRGKDDTLTQIKQFIPDQVVDSIYISNNRVWVSSTGRISWISIDNLKYESFQVDGKDNQHIRPILFDSHKNLWVLAEDRLQVYHLLDKTFQTVTFPSNGEHNDLKSAIGVVEHKDYYWIASQGSGLFKVDMETFEITKKVNTEIGLASNSIFTLLKKDDYLWVATSRGINKVDADSGEVLYHVSPKQLDFNEFNESAGLVLQDGNILFGGTQGFHYINPTRLSSVRDNKNESLPSPKVTKLSIFNREVSFKDANSPLTKPVYLSKEIHLPNNASPFSLNFAVINPRNPDTLAYRYQLLGLSEQWLEADPNQRQATFTNLGFGTYQFRVQARESNGPWSDAGEVTLKIAPPKWMHQYALVAYGILGFLVLSYWFRQYELRKLTQRKVKDSEERLKLTLWGSGDELWDWDLNQAEVFRSNLWGIMDFPQDNLRVFTELESNIHPVDLQRVRQVLEEHLQGDSEHFESTYRVKDFRGNWLWVLDRGKVVAWNQHKKPSRMTGTLKNISHLKQAEEQLRLFQRSIETISDGVFITDTQFRIISVNNSYCKYTGDSKEQALASYLTFHQYPAAFTEEVRKTLVQKGNWSGEVESMRRTGERYEIDLNIDAIHGEDGATTHYVGVFSDITSRKKTEKDLLQLANSDTLTGLPNRSFFQASHKNLVRKGSPHALLCMDMDNFKKINDSMGHQTGDQLIKQIAARLQKFADANATCYRLGGDEFSLLIEGKMDIHKVTHLAQRILDEMARPFTINHQEFVLGGSLGITFFPEDGASPQELLKNADTAMYFAKNSGGNRYQFFSGEMNQNAVRQLQIENLIRHGIKEDLFTVYYQPKVDIASGQLVSMEALVRFEHPEKGIVSPAQFIPLAEETGQIIDIGEIVLRKACEDTQRWVKDGLFTGRVAINISARQFELPDLDQRIERALRRAGLSPLHLECEITEGTLMQNPDRALQMMQRLRDMGIHLALDDFGTGYSSLAYLKRFPLNTLKIDKAFIDDIATSAVDRHMTSAIITIAHNLGLKVVAEGVEEEQQLSILRRYECEMLQGYLYSKPLSAERFTRLLHENRHLSKLIKQSNH
ncbi:EAL domain-containing protein [Aliiglaciecola sp. CAU 1673]|uniref:EAL domain-containing protein n=1 Tax=Aliiglaciecola sp. CAU 1673 TaxID=3032595 RepID=UPI0023D9E6C8|nr:EAL domain-containing protein [Aliiglaciecola sp. CAU 1673]MDF2177126.1 EAL domain-containing protein [Aliiglaciecola sp. CAU 1673]